MTGAGTVTATIASGVATDLAGNANAAATSGDNSVTFDSVVPVATGIVRADLNPTGAATVHFTVTFSKSVSGVDASDFALLPAGVTGATITAVTGSGTTWIVAVNTGAGSGTLGLKLIDDDSIIDAASNPLGGPGSTNGDFSSGEIYTIDKTAPLASNLDAATISTAGGTTQSITVVFSDNLALDSSSLDSSDILVTGPAGFSQLATLVSVTPASNGTPRTATYQITAAGGSWDTADNGTYTVAVQANQVRDTVGNSAVGSVLGTFSVSISATRYSVYLPIVMR